MHVYNLLIAPRLDQGFSTMSNFGLSKHGGWGLLASKVEGGDAAEHPRVHRTVLLNIELASQKCQWRRRLRNPGLNDTKSPFAAEILGFYDIR